MFRAVFASSTPAAIVLGVLAAVFSVVAFFYYAAVVRQMWFREPVELGETASTKLPAALGVALALTVIVVVVVGVYPQLFARIGDLAFRVG